MGGSKKTKNATFPLKLVLNQDKSKLLFAEVDGDFADVLLSFLSFPLGTIARIFHGDGAPPLGSSLATLYKGLADLADAHFCTKEAKSILLDPPFSCEYECRRVKLDLSGCQHRPLEYFYCSNYCYGGGQSRSSSVYYDKLVRCNECGDRSIKRRLQREDRGGGDMYGGFVSTNAARFVVTDDLQILCVGTEVLQVLSVLGITDLDNTKTVSITFGFAQVMDLLKACLISSTPLSDVIFNRRKSATTRLQSNISLDDQIQNAANLSSLSGLSTRLKVVRQKSTKRFLYAEAGDEFVEFLFSLLFIPAAQVENLLEGNSPLRGITSLHRSVAHPINNDHFMCLDNKFKLLNPEIPHGCLPETHILPLLQQHDPDFYPEIAKFSYASIKFPQGQGKYLKPRTRFMVANDLTVTPLSVASMFALFKGVEVHVSDVEQLELKIGLKEGLHILRASLTSTSALTDALDLTHHTSHNQVKQQL